MNEQTGRIYYGDAEIKAAEGRGERLTELTQEEALKAQAAARRSVQQQRGRPFRRDPVTGMKLRLR